MTKAGSLFAKALVLAVGLFLGGVSALATVHTAGDFSELEFILSNATDGDVVNITSDIAFTAMLFVKKDLLIQSGNGGPYKVDASDNNQLFKVMHGANATFYNLWFVDGSASMYGGALTNYGNLSVAACTFRSNRITGNGGAALWNGPTAQATLAGCTLTLNRAYMGGTLYNAGGSLSVSDSTFTSNTMTDNYGGTVYNAGVDADVSVVDSVFADNYAGNGADIENEGTATVVGSNFSGITTDSGANAIHGTSDSTETVSNSVFFNLKNGAALYLQGTASVNSSTFYNNTGFVSLLRGGDSLSLVRLGTELQAGARIHARVDTGLA